MDLLLGFKKRALARPTLPPGTQPKYLFLARARRCFAEKNDLKNDLKLKDNDLSLKI